MNAKEEWLFVWKEIRRLNSIADDWAIPKRSKEKDIELLYKFCYSKFFFIAHKCLNARKLPLFNNKQMNRRYKLREHLRLKGFDWEGGKWILIKESKA